MKLISSFIDDLTASERFDCTTNQYSTERTENVIRRDNLYAYLSVMYNLKPSVLLVSEAPGYNGMKRTGIPFTSERILLTHSFFKNGNYRVVSFNDTRAESSATIVWSVLDSIDASFLMWPSFPFHPHKKDSLDSNRPPTKNELKFGEKFLKDLIGIFEIKTTIAVGRKAEKSLKSLGYQPKYIRHPSQGGANDFKEGLIGLYSHK